MGGSYASDDYIPMALDPNVAEGPSPMLEQKTPQANGKTLGSANADQEPPNTDYFNIKEKSAKRKIPREKRNDDMTQMREFSQPASPRISVQREEVEAESLDVMKRRKPSNTGLSSHEGPTRETHQYNRSQTDQERFKLQEAPKRRKSSSHRHSGNGFESREGFPSLPLETAGVDSSPVSAHAVLREQHVNIERVDSARTSQMDTPTQASPRASQDSRFGENGPISGFDVNILPKRGDSLQKSVQSASSIHRKDVPSAKPTAQDTHLETSPIPPSSATSLDTSFDVGQNLSTMNGGRVISRPMESPISKSARDGDEPYATGSDSFASPRAAPPLPTPESLKHRAKNHSINTLRSESYKSGDQPASPGLSQFMPLNDRHTDKDSRTFSEESTTGTGNIFRKFSKSSLHSRSQSDRGNRITNAPRWPKTPINGTFSTGVDQELGSPILSSPDLKGDVALANEINRLRDENKAERKKVLDLEAQLADFRSTANNNAAMIKMKDELVEKRSTLAQLDSHERIVASKLDILTKHLAAAQNSGTTLDHSSKQQQILEEFANALQKIENSCTKQIEDRVRCKRDLDEEIAQLTQQKERLLLEIQQLSTPNPQLADLNNDLANKLSKQDPTASASHGLGIHYQHHKEKSNISLNSREIASLSDSQITIHGGEHPPDSATMISTPQVVNMQKVGPKKRNIFSKGGTVAKGMTKGFKGAFSSVPDSKLSRDFNIPTNLTTEGIPYGSTLTGAEPSIVNTLPSRSTEADAKPQGFGFFSQPKSKTVLTKAPANSPLPSKLQSDPSGKRWLAPMISSYLLMLFRSHFLHRAGATCCVRRS